MKYTVNEWRGLDQTARDAAFAKLPETTTEGYIKGGFSGVVGMDYLINYFDANDEYAGSQNLLNGKFEKTGFGSIEVFMTNDGGSFEMKAVGKEKMDEDQARKSVERALEMAIVEDGVKYGYPSLPGVSNLDTFFPALRLIEGIEFGHVDDFGLKVPNSTASLEVNLRPLGGGSIFIYPSDENMATCIYVRGVSPYLFHSIVWDYENTKIPAKP